MGLPEVSGQKSGVEVSRSFLQFVAVSCSRAREVQKGWGRVVGGVGNRGVVESTGIQWNPLASGRLLGAATFQWSRVDSSEEAGSAE